MRRPRSRFSGLNRGTLTHGYGTERERLRALRDDIAQRRRTLAQARGLPAAPPPPHAHAHALDQASLAAALARARSGLVQELVEVFNVVEVGGRPPVGGRAGTKGEWTVGDLVLPVPGDIRRACAACCAVCVC